METKPFSEQGKAVRPALNLSDEELVYVLGVSSPLSTAGRMGRQMRQRWRLPCSTHFCKGNNLEISGVEQ